LVRFGAKSRCATSICNLPLCASRRFAQLIDFIAHRDVHSVNLREKYDYPVTQIAATDPSPPVVRQRSGPSQASFKSLSGRSRY
jgi:hypothetical protein